MFQFKKYIKYLGVSFLAAAFGSCGDSDRPLQSQESDVPEGMVKVSLKIPEIREGFGLGGSRAFDTEEEGYMSNLFVVAARVKGYVYELMDVNGEIKEVKKEEVDYSANPQITVAILDPTGYKTQVGSVSYDDYSINLYPGEYRFYVVANFNLYLNEGVRIRDFKEEKEIKELVLNYRPDTPLIPNHLPMACLPKEIRWSDNAHLDYEGKFIEQPVAPGDGQNSPALDYLVTIEKGKDPQVYAPMDFLCSKVRYTILFDNSDGGVSKEFPRTLSYRFFVDDKNQAYAERLYKQTKLMTDYSENDTDYPGYDNQNPYMAESWKLDLGRFYYPRTDLENGAHDANYPLRPSDNLTAWDQDMTTWYNSHWKAWQGVVYLPEDSGIGEERTRLVFPFMIGRFESQDGPLVLSSEIESENPKIIHLFGNTYADHFVGGNTPDASYTQLDKEEKLERLERNRFYDVVAKVINPDGVDLYIQVYINILAWRYHEPEITDW